MTNKKENKNITVDLANNTKNKDISKINLSASEKRIYDKVVNHNKDGNSINKDVSTLLNTGKKGIESIERIAKALKDNNEPLNAYKMAVSRFYKDTPKENKLSLQGLGANGVPFIGKLSNSGGNSKKTKAVKTNIDSVNTFIDEMVDSERVEYIFDLVDSLSNVDKKAMIEWLISEVKKVA
jgi:hypothetical protein